MKHKLMNLRATLLAILTTVCLTSSGYTYKEVMVPCKDGTKLMTHIYLPDGEGPWPVVCTRTPYNFNWQGDQNEEGRQYAQRGIGYIIQDCRGKGGSEGVFVPNVNERSDGIDFYCWLQDQPWVKSAGIFGSSYVALTCWLVADSLPEKVKGIYLSHYGVDRYVSCFHSGLFRQDIMSGWLISNCTEDIRRPEKKPGQKEGEENYDFYRYMPHVEADEAVLGMKIPYYRDWITHTDHDDPYWDTDVWGDLKRIPPRIKLPMTIVAGQFDHHEEGTLLGYEWLSDETKAKSRLILGSWIHFFYSTPTHVPNSHAMDIKVAEDQYNWFYSLLVKEEEPKAEILAYNIEADEWMNLDSWPIEPNSRQRLYLSAQTSQTDTNAHGITSQTQAEESTIHFTYDPQNPVFSVGGETVFTSIRRLGSQLQPQTGYRDDVISFISEPLMHDITIAGNIRIMLSVATDCDDTSFAITLSELEPDGKAYNMRTSIATLGYRDGSLGSRKIYQPNSRVMLPIECQSIVWTVKAGKRLRLDVKSSDFPQFAIHTNYAGVWAENGKTRLAHQTIYVGGNQCSYIELPCIKSSAAKR